MTYNYRGSRFSGREGSVPDWRRAPVASSDWRDLLEDPRAAQVDNAVTWLIDKAYIETVGLAPDGDLLLRLTDKAWENDHILDADVREERQARVERRPFDRQRDDRPRDDRQRDDRQRENRDDRNRQRDRNRPRFNQQGEGEIEQAEGRNRFNGEARNLRGPRPVDESSEAANRELAPLGEAPAERTPRPPINRDSPGVRLPPVQREAASDLQPDVVVQVDSPRQDAPIVAEPVARQVAPVEAPRAIEAPAVPDLRPADVSDAPVVEDAPKRPAPRSRRVAAVPAEAVTESPVEVPVVVPVVADMPVGTDEVVAPAKPARASRAKPKDVAEGEDAPAPKPRTRRKVTASDDASDGVPVAPAVEE